MHGKELKLENRANGAEGALRQRAFSCEEVARLRRKVERLRRDAQATGNQMEAFVRANDALHTYLEESSLDDWIAILSSNMLLAAVRIFKAAGGVLYLKDDSPIPGKRMIAAVEDDQIVDISTDARFQPLAKFQLIGVAAKTVWSRLADPGGYWLTNVDDPIVPPKIVKWHRKLGHTWLAHFALGHNSSLLGFFVVAYRDGQVIEPASVHLGIILAMQITIALERVNLARRAQESALSEARSRSYRDLEDPLAQGFAGIAIHLGAATRALGTAAPDAQTHIDTALGLARENLDLARRSTSDVRGREGPLRGLVGSLKAYVVSIQHTTSATIQTNLKPSTLKLSCASERSLLRITQEAVRNAVKHSAAKTIRVGLVEMATGGIRLSVKDDGIGFDCQQSRRGIDSMRQRASALRAELTIITEPGLGTELIVVLPSE